MPVAALDYDYLSTFLQQSSGLSLGAGKDYLLESRLVPLAQSMGLNDLRTLVTELRRGRDTRLADAVAEAMTTNETSFFRDKTPFQDLKNVILPAVRERNATKRTLRIWCCAASTGQEPYSVLMQIREAFPDMATWKIDYIASDISPQMLERAEKGMYTQFEVQRGLPVQYLVKYFAETPNGWQVHESLRQMVRWKRLNLLDPFSALGHFDIVMCRNVLIYFDVPTKKDILNRIGGQLNPGGVLMLGTAESVLGITDTFTRHADCQSATFVPAK